MKLKLLDLLGTPSVSLLVGKRGSGKTALGCFALERAHERGLKSYIMGLPSSKRNLLPDYIKLISTIDNVPDDSVVFCDESYLYLFAREHPKSFNRWMSKLMGVSRQKNWTLIFSSHTARKLDIGIVLDADNLVIRQPSWLHVKYERQELRELIEPAAKFFKKGILKLKDKDPVKYAYIYTEKGFNIVTVPLPEFWSEDLSRAFSGLGVKEIGKP